MKIAMSKQVNIPTPYEGRSIAKHLGKCVLEYMKDEEHKREFMELKENIIEILFTIITLYQKSSHIIMMTVLLKNQIIRMMNLVEYLK